MVAYHLLAEKFTSDYYINAAKKYEHFSDQTKYFATVTSLDNLEEIESIDCSSEHEALSAFKRLINIYNKGV